MSRFAALTTEPSPERLGNPVLRLFLATRPAFLSITLGGCLLGQATALSGDYRFQPVLMLLILLLAGWRMLCRREFTSSPPSSPTGSPDILNIEGGFTPVATSAMS